MLPEVSALPGVLPAGVLEPGVVDGVEAGGAAPGVSLAGGVAGVAGAGAGAGVVVVVVVVDVPLELAGGSLADCLLHAPSARQVRLASPIVSAMVALATVCDVGFIVFPFTGIECFIWFDCRFDFITASRFPLPCTLPLIDLDSEHWFATQIPCQSRAGLTLLALKIRTT